MTKTDCEYCGAALPKGVDKLTRRVRSTHFMRHAADREQESERQRQHAFDCRTCAHFTAKGCYSTVACIEARQYKATAPRQYWAALAEGDGR